MPTPTTSPPSWSYWRKQVSCRPALLTTTRAKISPYCPHKPTPPQEAFLLLPHREAFYGGAAGGGKSDALLMGALADTDTAGYAALLLRRTYADLALPGAIMDRAHAWLAGTDAHWNDREKTYSFPSGATLTFGYLEHEQDKFRYQGAEFQFIGVDELPQFSETQYTYLLSRLRRRAGVRVPLRMRGAGNPGGIGHEWVKARFIAAGHRHPFIPARLDDNPHLDRDAYRASLAGLDDVTRAQLERGDWDVVATGDLFDRHWFQPQTTPYTATARVRAWDLAATAGAGDYTAGALVARTPEGHYVVEDVVRGQWDVGTRDATIRAVAERDGHAVRVVLEEEGGSAGKSQTASLVARLAGFDVTGARPTGPKAVRARPFASQVRAGTARYLPGAWVSAWITELAAFAPLCPHDDQVDATAAAFNALAAAPALPFGWYHTPHVQAPEAALPFGWHASAPVPAPTLEQQIARDQPDFATIRAHAQRLETDEERIARRLRARGGL